ncbi:hypothetical protein HYT17_01155 [Candidatus Microgenomates bacterium]|nr:hypothetical protein [Candidatus Microgenomates bacterium]
MANYGGFYKGDKKKPKKERLANLAAKVEGQGEFGAPVFSLPKIIPKGKNKNEENA